MTKSIEPVTEIDVMAYADGLLDGDIARKRIVEAHIARDPESAARVEEIQAQNAAIRERYEAILADPTPPHLAALPRRDAAPARAWPRVAVLAGLLAVSGVTGWLVRAETEPGKTASDRFLERAAREHKTSATAVLERTDDADAASSEVLATLTRQISFQMAAPDLSRFGYTLVDKQQIGGSENPIVRLVYRNANKAHISLLLRPRWEEETTVAKSFEEDGVTIRHWLDGPIELALVTNDADVVAEHLAGAIHDAIAQARLRDIAGSKAGSGSTVNIDSNVIEGTKAGNAPLMDAGGRPQKPTKAN